MPLQNMSRDCEKLAWGRVQARRHCAGPSWQLKARGGQCLKTPGRTQLLGGAAADHEPASTPEIACDELEEKLFSRRWPESWNAYPSDAAHYEAYLLKSGT